MKTDSLFYRLFQSAPTLFFELIGQFPVQAERYIFCSVELKQTAFRIDGIFLPPPETDTPKVYFVEVWFQRDEQLYRHLFETIVVYKFPQLSRREVELMLGLSDLKQTRVYQEALEEGEQLAAKSIVLRLLTRKLGDIPKDLRGRIEELSLTQLENLGEALLDFEQIDDLVNWLEGSQQDG